MTMELAWEDQWNRLSAYRWLDPLVLPVQTRDKVIRPPFRWLVLDSAKGKYRRLREVHRHAK